MTAVTDHTICACCGDPAAEHIEVDGFLDCPTQPTTFQSQEDA